MTTVAATLRNAEFRGLIAAQIASEAGDQIARVALAYLVLDRTGSALGAAVTFAIMWVPSLFGAALLGPIADRFPRRTLMLGADFGRAAVVALLALVAIDATPIAVLLLLLLVAEFLTPVFDAARTASIPSILGDAGRVSAGMGLARTLHQISQVVGIVLGGAIAYLVDPRVGLAVNALSFVVSFVILLLTLHKRPATLESTTSIRVLATDLRLGAADLFADPARRALVVLSWCMAAFVVAPEVLGIATSRHLTLPDYWGGILMAATVAGAAVGSVWIGRIPPSRQITLVLPLALGSLVLLLPTGLEPPVWVIVALWFIAGALQAFVVTVMVFTSLLTRDEYRGRVISLAGTGFYIAYLLGTLLAGLIGDLSTPTYAVTVLASVGLLALGANWLRWPHRALDRAATAISD